MTATVKHLVAIALLFLWILVRVLFGLYSWQFLSAFLFLGWLAAPLTHLLFWFLALFSRETPILAGGIGVARAFFLLQVLFDLIVQSPLNKNMSHHH